MVFSLQFRRTPMSRSVLSFRIGVAGVSRFIGATSRPERAQLLVEALRSLFGKENTRAFEPPPPPRPRERLFQPLRPFDVEIDVVVAPNNERGRFQRTQLRLYRDGVDVVERKDETL